MWDSLIPRLHFSRSAKSSLGTRLGVERVESHVQEDFNLSLLSYVQLQGNLFGIVLADESVWTLGMHA